MSDYRETAEQSVEAIERAAERLALASRMEMALEDERPILKSEAIRRLMATENPETNKPHSASSAEKVVESDGEYAAFRRKQYAAVVETIRARGAYDAAKRRADIAIDLALAVAGGVR